MLTELQKCKIHSTNNINFSSIVTKILNGKKYKYLKLYFFQIFYYISYIIYKKFFKHYQIYIMFVFCIVQKCLSK